MELGSLVCTPSDPQCAECPLRGVCRAFADGLQEEIPQPKRRPQFTLLHEAAIVVKRKGEVLLRQCGEQERWAGLWDFPRFPVDGQGPPLAQDEVVHKLRQFSGVKCGPPRHLKTIKHGVTRYRITLDCYRAAFVSGRIRSSKHSSLRWVTLTRLRDYPLSTTGRRIAGLIE